MSLTVPLLAGCDYFTLPMPPDPGPASVKLLATAPLVTTDRGGVATFTISLGVKPLADVQMGISSSDPGAATVSPAVVTFNSSNWDLPQEITVRGVTDSVRTGDRSYFIVFAPAVSTDARFDRYVASAIQAVALDAEVAGLVATPSAGLVTTESGHAATFTVRLRSAPVTDVIVPVASSNPAEGTVAPAAIVFTPSNWSIPQTVTVTGVDDLAVDGDVEYQILLGPTASADPGYDGVPCDPVQAVNFDDESAGFVITPAEGLVTTEQGGTARFTVALESRPTAAVTIGVSTTARGEGIATPASLTFGPDDWSQPRTVTLTGQNDTTVDGPKPYDVVFAPAVSDDLRYAGLVAPPVHATNLDDDVVGIRVEPTTGLVTTESGGTATFTIALDARPDADVTITMYSTEPGEGTVWPDSVTFTPDDWSTPRTVTLTGVDDAVQDGPRAYTIVTVPAVSADPRYDGLDASNVWAVNQDND